MSALDWSAVASRALSLLGVEESANGGTQDRSAANGGSCVVACVNATVSSNA